MRRISPLYNIGFQLYNVIPYVYEFRTILDWVCSNTTLLL